MSEEKEKARVSPAEFKTNSSKRIQINQPWKDSLEIPEIFVNQCQAQEKLGCWGELVPINIKEKWNNLDDKAKEHYYRLQTSPMKYIGTAKYPAPLFKDSEYLGEGTVRVTYTDGFTEYLNV